MLIRSEQPSDRSAICAVLRQAFAPIAYSAHDEHEIVDALRDADALLVSLVAIDDHEIIGHIACSPVEIDDSPSRWAGLGPVGVLPSRQKQGVGQALVRTSIEQLKINDLEGIVLLGNPAYYSRFGFRRHAALRFPDAPAEYFLALPLRGSMPNGVVRYHDAFDSKKRAHNRT